MIKVTQCQWSKKILQIGKGELSNECVYKLVLAKGVSTGKVWKLDALKIASYPGRVGGEKWPGINCLRMRGHFRYISVKL